MSCLGGGGGGGGGTGVHERSRWLVLNEMYVIYENALPYHTFDKVCVCVCVCVCV